MSLRTEKASDIETGGRFGPPPVSPLARPGKRALLLVISIYPLLLLLLWLAQVIRPQRMSLLTLAEVFAPVLLLLPLALQRQALLLGLILFFAWLDPLPPARLRAEQSAATHLEVLSWNVLDIDYMFSDPGTAPLRFAVDCGRASSDHCAIQGRFEIR